MPKTNVRRTFPERSFSDQNRTFGERSLNVISCRKQTFRERSQNIISCCKQRHTLPKTNVARTFPERYYFAINKPFAELKGFFCTPGFHKAAEVFSSPSSFIFHLHLHLHVLKGSFPSLKPRSLRRRYRLLKAVQVQFWPVV